MRTRLYLLLVLVRLYFAVSPSYIHPDENFQGPEVIAGESTIFCTWRFEYVMAGMAVSVESLTASKLCVFDWRLTFQCREYLQFLKPPHLGVHFRKSGAQRLPTMACLWSAYGAPAMALDGYKQPLGSSVCRLLHPPHRNVRLEFRAGRLGNT
jgi:hypothetical protein